VVRLWPEVPVRRRHRRTKQRLAQPGTRRGRERLAPAMPIRRGWLPSPRCHLHACACGGRACPSRRGLCHRRLACRRIGSGVRRCVPRSGEGLRRSRIQLRGTAKSATGDHAARAQRDLRSQGLVIRVLTGPGSPAGWVLASRPWTAAETSKTSWPAAGPGSPQNGPGWPPMVSAAREGYRGLTRCRQLTRG
jgi:hypothetical protein